jgi:hypothetical protein
VQINLNTTSSAGSTFAFPQVLSSNGNPVFQRPFDELLHKFFRYLRFSSLNIQDCGPGTQSAAPITPR